MRKSASSQNAGRSRGRAHGARDASKTVAGPADRAADAPPIDPATRMPREIRPDLLALAIAGANDGLWDWEAKTDRTYRSARVQEIAGQTPIAVTADSSAWLTLIHPEDRERYKQGVRALFKGPSNRFEIAYRLRHADGTYRWVLDRAIALRDERGRVCRMAGSVSDITERRRVEDALRESEQRFRDYVETASDWYWETGPDHCFTVHPDEIRAYGIDPATRLGRRRTDVAADLEEESEKWRKHLATLDRHEPFRDFVYKIRLDSGATRFVSVSGKPVFDASGSFVGYRGSGRDVTDAVVSAQALRQAIRAAEAANRAKTEFLANMSHEVRTPLNAILGFAEVIGQEMLGPVGNPRYCEYAMDILRSGRHLLELINDILDMSKVEAGKLELHEARVSVRAAVEACLPFVRQRSAQGGVEIRVEVGPDLPDVLADEVRLKQILLNLLTNAVKFTPRAGRVIVSAGLGSDRSLTLRVADTGIGMSRADIKQALLPFHQIESPLAKRFEGTGLGLPLSKRLVELHGGTLEIDSILGKGTTVTVHLPSTRVLADAPDAA